MGGDWDCDQFVDHGEFTHNIEDFPGSDSWIEAKRVYNEEKLIPRRTLTQPAQSSDEDSSSSRKSTASPKHV